MEETRPCFLVVDRESAGSISTRKLVIETAKFNVITAYSAVEAVATLRRFPAVDGIVLDAGMRDMLICELVQRLKSLGPSVPVIVVARPGAIFCPEADHNLDSFDPSRILELLQSLEPEQTAAIQRHDAALAVEE